MYRGREGACTLSLRLVLADTTHYPLTQYTEPYRYLQPRTHQHPTAPRTSHAHDTTHLMHKPNCSRKHAGGAAPPDWHRACPSRQPMHGRAGVVREVVAAVAGEAWQGWSDGEGGGEVGGGGGGGAGDGGGGSRGGGARAVVMWVGGAGGGARALAGEGPSPRARLSAGSLGRGEGRSEGRRGGRRGRWWRR